MDVWFALLFLATLAPWCAGDQSFSLLPPQKSWWWAPAILIGFWSTTSLAASLMLMNDMKRFAQLNCICLLAAIAYGYVSFQMTLRGQQSTFDDVMSMVTGIVSLIVVAVFLYVARQKEFVSRSTTLACVAGRSVMGAVVLYGRFRVPSDSVSFSILALGIAAMSMLPFAVTPMAVAHNRHC